MFEICSLFPVATDSSLQEPLQETWKIILANPFSSFSPVRHDIRPFIFARMIYTFLPNKVWNFMQLRRETDLYFIFHLNENVIDM